VTFLATLELVRRRQVRAEQSDLFGPIVIEALPEASQP
jgi:chromatin segregation and condensation protein Rec8/ScpA/Scc1 (kleisin family)